MSKVNIYRFRSYDIQNDETKLSSRWGTRQAIKDIACGQIIEDSEREVDESVVKSDIEGMTERNNNPDWTTAFQTEAKRSRIDPAAPATTESSAYKFATTARISLR